MTLSEALDQLKIPESYSIYLTIYYNHRGEHRVRVELRKGSIRDKNLKEFLLDVLPDANYDWYIYHDRLFATINNCSRPYRITTRITMG